MRHDRRQCDAVLVKGCTELGAPLSLSHLRFHDKSHAAGTCLLSFTYGDQSRSRYGPSRYFISASAVRLTAC